MKTRDNVLRLLDAADGNFISGSEIALRLHISRNAVWKTIALLKDEGYIIESDHISGYRLSLYNTKLFSFQFERFCKGYKVIFLDSVDSTNTYLKHLAECGEGENTVVIARTQTAGKGRLGRNFLSSEGGLYMSLLLRPDMPLNESLQITVAAASAVCKTLNTLYNVDTKIKWVNDIFKNGKKICGILTEGAVCAESGKLNYCVLGVGINVSKPKGDFDDSIKDIATTLFDENKVSSYEYAKIANEFLCNFKEYYSNIKKREYIKYYRENFYLKDKTVTFIKDGQTHVARVVALGDNAELILSENGKEINLSAGEVSVKV